MTDGFFMDGIELRAIRLKLGLNRYRFAIALGYNAEYGENYLGLIENGRNRINPRIARLARMYEMFGVPQEWMPSARIRHDWPHDPLIHRLKQKGLSQRKIAREIGIDPHTVRRALQRESRP